MAISPPSDIVLEVVKAADPASRAEAAGKLARLAGTAAPDPGAFEEVLGDVQTRPAAVPQMPFDPALALVMRRNGDTLAAKPAGPYEQFEAFVLQSFIQSMLPKDGAALFGSGTAGEVWRSMLADGLGKQLASAGGIGIAKTLATAGPADAPTTTGASGIGTAVELAAARQMDAGARTAGAPAAAEITRAGESGTPAQAVENDQAVELSAAPVIGARLSSHFGPRKHPIHGNVRMHAGVDYAAEHGTPVFASGAGTVSFVGTRGAYGQVVEIQHGAEVMTRYAHLGSYADGLEVGQRVKAGEQIGAVGATGLATGPHLHYEVRHAGRPVDPLSDEHLTALAAPAHLEASGTAPARPAARDSNPNGST